MFNFNQITLLWQDHKLKTDFDQIVDEPIRSGREQCGFKFLGGFHVQPAFFQNALPNGDELFQDRIFRYDATDIACVN